MLPDEDNAFHPCDNACDLGNHLLHEITKLEVLAMKVVVVRSPKMLRGLLKLIFKIKEES